MSTQLKRLDNRLVTVEVSLNGQSQVCRGRGKFSFDPELGPVLGIAVADPAGDFEFLIEADKWSGEVVADASGESEYRICLNAACTCSI